MGLWLYMWSVIGQNVVMQHIILELIIKKTYVKETEEKKKIIYKGTIIVIADFSAQHTRRQRAKHEEKATVAQEFPSRYN